MDVLYAGWVEDQYREIDVNSWIESLQDRLLTLRECALSIAVSCTSKRNKCFNERKSMRELVVGEQVLFRVQGLHGALEVSYKGPYVVKEKLSCVNYRITNLDGKKPRIVHINNTKKYSQLLLV